MADKFSAIVSLRPGASFGMKSDGSIDWLDNNTTCPTDTEIQAEIARLQADYDAKQYQRDRANAYPSIVDQLDTLYHEGYNGWKAQIQAIKDQFPKGAN
jgi:hypothetical protein